MPTPAKEPGRAGNLTVIRATRDSKPPQGIPIPSSWRDIEPERCELTEEGWAFIKDAVTDLSEEGKTRFVTEASDVVTRRGGRSYRWMGLVPSTEPREARSRLKNGGVEDGDVEGGSTPKSVCATGRDYAGIEEAPCRHRSARYQSTTVAPRSASPA